VRGDLRLIIASFRRGVDIKVRIQYH